MSTANFVPKRIRFSRYQKKQELQGLYIKKDLQEKNLINI